ncbi:hypothetical protein LSM04_005418 [Trypanosoma melophagium]|uniref:uncharacterized protein n=1 Tax=Trypanosoma melophagium TaxID=715481 RepID=UPI00351A7C05|nr:hypothetical protein LSM04_005418 [Trypanosoma melophagium]
MNPPVKTKFPMTFASVVSAESGRNKKNNKVTGTSTTTTNNTNTATNNNSTTNTTTTTASSDPVVLGTIDEPPLRGRRGGRRAQRLGMLQDSTSAATETTTTTTGTAATTIITPKVKPKQAETVVVPVRGETSNSVGEKCPVNRTSVRRRPKPNSTITKVVTGVSLEDLRAKRNGTAEESVTGGDAKTIEEVSRILFMYASQHHHQQQQIGGKHHFNKRFPSRFEGNEQTNITGERGGSYGGGAEISPMMTMRKNEFLPGDQQQQHVFGGFDGFRAVQAHVMSLIHSGKLPADSLEVLQAILCHSSRGGKLDFFDPARRNRHDGNPMEVIPGTGGDVLQLQEQQQQQSFLNDFYCYTQQQMTNSAQTEYFGYSGYPSYAEQMYYHELGASSSTLMSLPPAISVLAGDGSSEMEGVGSFPYLNTYTAEQQQEPKYQLQYYNSEAAVGGGGISGYRENGAYFTGSAVRVVSTNHNDNNNNNNNDDEDDADVSAMLHGIREVVQQGSSSSPSSPLSSWSSKQQQQSCNLNHLPFTVDNTGEVTPTADGDARNDVDDVCVTISHTERETLRSLQKAFLARMRIAGSPEWQSPGATPPKNLLDAFMEDVELDTHMEQEQEEEKFATNRTLFSYRTAFLDEVDGTTLDEPVTRDASVATTAAALKQQQQQQQQYIYEETLTDTRASHFFTAMRGEDEEVERLWSWTADDEDRAATTTGTTAAATLTPSRWFSANEIREPYAQSQLYTHTASILASSTPEQPTTEKKELQQQQQQKLQVRYSPFSPSAYSLLTPNHIITTPIATSEVLKKGNTASNNSDRLFIPPHIGTITSYMF